MIWMKSASDYDLHLFLILHVKKHLKKKRFLFLASVQISSDANYHFDYGTVSSRKPRSRYFLAGSILCNIKRYSTAIFYQNFLNFPPWNILIIYMIN
jgi:hypothetical protein